MAGLSEERRARAVVGGLYGVARGARMPPLGPLDDGRCRTWQFACHANADGTLSMRDTYWSGMRADPHDARYDLDDSNFDETFPLFELLAGDIGSWRRDFGEGWRLYDEADVVLVDGGSRGTRWHAVRPGAEKVAAYEVAAARAALDEAVARAKRALDDARRLAGELEGAVAAAEASGADWDGSAARARAASRLAGAERAPAGEAGCAGEVEIVSARGRCGRAVVGAGEELSRCPCAVPGASAWAVPPGGPHGRVGLIVVTDGEAPVLACDLTPGNLDAVASCGDAGALAGALGCVDPRVSGNADAAASLARARALPGFGEERR